MSATRDVVKRLALKDRVFEVKEAAYRIALALGIQNNGKPLFLGKKDIGYKKADFTKAFKRVVRESKMEVFDLAVFKAKFQITNPEMYDVMSYEKEGNFDSWIESIFKGLPKK